jgi:hypothetical protein
MITHSTSIGPGGAPGPDPRRPRVSGGADAAPAARDRVSTPGSTSLRSALAATPAIRPEVVERAKALALDPNYPPLQIIERVARLIAQSEDLSEIPD